MRYLLYIFLFMILHFQPLHAKKIFPSDIMGRDLAYPPPVGWAGHVGIATRDMINSKGMSTPADQTIEILNEPPNIGQINTIDNFKKRSKYWGSKYGVIGNPEQGYKVLVEANHQRWWVRKYTFDTAYRIGEGNPTTGEIFVTGIWRCDTYAWWAFYSQGIDLVPGHIILPSKVFNAFPYVNDERPFTFIDTVLNSDVRTLDDVTTEELNEMQQEEFQMLMDAPSKTSETYLMTAQESAYMRFAFDDKLSDFKRGIMIDRLTIRGSEPDLVPKLIKLYYETNNSEVRYRIISGLMSYNQVQLRDHPNARDQELLKKFFFDLIHDTLNSASSNDVVLGFIQTHSADEISRHLDKIDAQLKATAHHLSIMTKYVLVHKSKKLQNIYIKSILNELREANSADVDDYFFGPLTIGYNGRGKDLLLPENTQLIIDYLNEVQYKYTKQGIQEASKTDPNRGITSTDYYNLLKAMNFNSQNKN